MSKTFDNVKDIFLRAIDIADGAERSAFLDSACNAESRPRVDALLAAYNNPASVLENPIVDRDSATSKTQASGNDPTPTPGLDDRTLAPVSSPSPAASTMESIEDVGSVIGPYKLLQRIGEGGFGTVYMAEQTHPVQRRVALKIIKPGMDTRDVVARFEAERQALAMMDHINIAQVFDAGATNNGRPFFVMELVKGVPITEYADKNKLTTKQRLRLFLDVCRAIQHAHLKGIIHRDIKPSNVMVTLHDGTPVVKVIDFGIAKATNQKLTEKTLFTSYGQMIGTPQYMSPEQAEMSGLDVDTRSDIYSLGVLLYELLTGTTPIESTQMREAGYLQMQQLIKESEAPRLSTRLSTMGDELTVIAKHRGSDPKRLGQLMRGELDWIVQKSLEKERNRRYESASTFAADVERYLDGDPVEACPPSTTYRLRKMIAKNRGLFTTLAAVVGALLLGLIVATFALLQARKDRSDAVTQKNAANTAREDADRERNNAEDKSRIAEQLRIAAESSQRDAQTQRDEAQRQAALADEQRQAAEAETSRARAAERRLQAHIDGSIDQMVKHIKTNREGSFFEEGSFVSQMINRSFRELGHTRAQRLVEKTMQYEDEIEPLYARATYNLYIGKQDVYDETCRMMLDRFGDTTDRAIADRVVKSCCLAPFAKDRFTLEQLDGLKWLTTVLQANVDEIPRNDEEERKKQQHYQSWSLMSLALYYYRIGNYDYAMWYVKDWPIDSYEARRDSVQLIQAQAILKDGKIEVAKNYARFKQSTISLLHTFVPTRKTVSHKAFDPKKVWDSIHPDQLRYLILCREFEPGLLGKIKTNMAEVPTIED